MKSATYKEVLEWKLRTHIRLSNKIGGLRKDSDFTDREKSIIDLMCVVLVCECEKCGRDIAAHPKGDALCCKCRYGEHSSRGYRNHVAEMDVVDTMSVNASRFRSGSEFWPGVIEKA